MYQRRLEIPHQSGQRAVFGFDRESGLYAISYIDRQLGQAYRKLFGRSDQLVVPQGESTAPFAAPGDGITLVGWPNQLLGQFAGDIVEV